MVPTGQQLYTEVRDGKFMKAQQAYFDPRDPSHVYIEQPDFVVKVGAWSLGVVWCSSLMLTAALYNNRVMARAPQHQHQLQLQLQQ